MFLVSSERVAGLIAWCNEHVGKDNYKIMLSFHWGQVHVTINDPQLETMAMLKFT